MHKWREESFLPQLSRRKEFLRKSCRRKWCRRKWLRLVLVYSVAGGCCSSYRRRRWADSRPDKKGIAWTNSLQQQNHIDYRILMSKSKKNVQVWEPASWLPYGHLR